MEANNHDLLPLMSIVFRLSSSSDRFLVLVLLVLVLHIPCSSRGSVFTLLFLQRLQRIYQSVQEREEPV